MEHWEFFAVGVLFGLLIMEIAFRVLKRLEKKLVDEQRKLIDLQAGTIDSQSVLIARQQAMIDQIFEDRQ